jgi:hypothetical protein
VTDGNGKVAIVLTAAIIVSQGSTAQAEAETRRQQYLTAVRFYARFAPVYFLENSGYDIVNDADFALVSGVRLRPISAQESEARGKGYREFHALDLWFDSEPEPPTHFMKITGRYLFANVEALLAECDAAPHDSLLFDRYIADKIALTSIFFTSRIAYARYIHGLYREVNDPHGVWIEHLVYRALEGAPCRSFRHEPDVGGVSGSSGTSMKASRLKYALRQGVRSINRIVDSKYLYLRGGTLKSMKRFLR